MPISKLDDVRFTQVCACCGSERTLDHTAASESNDDCDGSVRFQLPACPQCGSVEFLIPIDEEVSKHPVPGSQGHLHRLLVNELARRKHTSDDAERRRLEPELARWFPDGLVLPTVFRTNDNERKTGAL